MRKKITALALLFICLIPAFSCAGADGEFQASLYAIHRQQIIDLTKAYSRGDYGDELFYLVAFSPWSYMDEYAVYRRDEELYLMIIQRGGRYKTRRLTREESTGFLSFINSQAVDLLHDRFSDILDGVDYQYLHCTQEQNSSFYINNPTEDSVYGALVSRFEEMAQAGEYKTAYRNENAVILINGEDAAVESVWKNGEDFRVCINRGGTLSWHRFKDGIIGEPVAEPPGITLQDAWSDVPEDYEHFNRYPWQVRWNSCLVRVLSGGLYLTEKNGNTRCILSGAYSDPVVIPDTDWVVCTKAEDGWANERKLVKINLRTHEELELQIKPGDSLHAVVYFQNKLLVYRDSETYVYDVTGDSFTQVYGDSLGEIAQRFLQPTDRPGIYYMADWAVNGTDVGIFDLNDFRFTKIRHFSDIAFDSMSMWVHEQSCRIYAVVNSDLVELGYETGIQ